ncbi:MAG: YcaO-like family protein [Proteobacteria bacterium]|nr:YcaO-like family protein [Pseudomonadota bacterium]
MDKSFRSNSEDIPIPPNFPNSVPLANYRIVQLSQSLFFATQDLSEDPLCPNGVFSTSVAVDRSEQEALTRARYEAAERFALGAILGGHQFITHSNIASNRIFEFPVKLMAPLNGNGRSPDTLFLEFSETFNIGTKYVAVADVFAPYPINKGECNWHPTTNGVAVGIDYKSARFASFAELLERHSIMQYWFEGRNSYLIELNQIRDSAEPEAVFLENLGYDLTCLEISAINSMFVILLFAKNRARHYPFFVCSAGSALTLQDAIRKASQETIQTLVACAGQTKLFSQWKDKGSSVHSLNHRMYYFADPIRGNLIERMNSNATAEAMKLADRPDSSTTFTFNDLQKNGLSAAFVDITPTSWNGSLNCVRCFSTTMIPILVSESMIQKHSTMVAVSRFGLPHPFP